MIDLLKSVIDAITNFLLPDDRFLVLVACCLVSILLYLVPRSWVKKTALVIAVASIPLLLCRLLAISVGIEQMAANREYRAILKPSQSMLAFIATLVYPALAAWLMKRRDGSGKVVSLGTFFKSGVVMVTGLFLCAAAIMIWERRLWAALLLSATVLGLVLYLFDKNDSRQKTFLTVPAVMVLAINHIGFLICGGWVLSKILEAVGEILHAVPTSGGASIGQIAENQRIAAEKQEKADKEWRDNFNRNRK